MSDSEYEQFLQFCTEFFISSDQLWCKNSRGEHQLVIPTSQRLFILKAAHDDVGHHGFFATNTLITSCYWWPFMGNDIVWFVKTCHLCQLQKTTNVLMPLTVATPALLFAEIYADTMHLLMSAGFKYIVQGCSLLLHWPEFNMLRKENG